MDPVQSGVHLLASAAVAVVLILVGRRFGRSDRDEAPVAHLAAGAIALALAWQFVIQEGRPTLPPASKWHTILFAVGAVAVVASIAEGLTRTAAVAERAFLFAAIAAGGLIAFGKAPLIGSMQPVHIGAAGAAVVVLFLNQLSRTRTGFALPAVLSISFASLAAMSLVGSFAKLGIIAGSTGVAVAAIALVTWRTKLALGAAGLATAVAGLAATAGLGAAYFDGHFSTPLWALPVAAPLAVLVAELPVIRRRPAFANATRLLAPTAIALAALGAAATQSLMNAPADADSSTGDGYGSGYGG
jgi:hypothetical protein